jgi:hypothetical protein
MVHNNGNIDIIKTGYMGRQNRMERLMKVINKDYTDKCIILKDRQEIQVHNNNQKWSKDVKSAFKSYKDVLFATKPNLPNFKHKKTSLSPINNMFNNISPDRFHSKADSQF